VPRIVTVPREILERDRGVRRQPRELDLGPDRRAAHAVRRDREHGDPDLAVEGQTLRGPGPPQHDEPRSVEGERVPGPDDAQGVEREPAAGEGLGDRLPDPGRHQVQEIGARIERLRGDPPLLGGPVEAARDLDGGVVDPSADAEEPESTARELRLHASVVDRDGPVLRGTQPQSRAVHADEDLGRRRRSHPGLDLQIEEALRPDPEPIPGLGGPGLEGRQGVPDRLVEGQVPRPELDPGLVLVESCAGEEHRVAEPGPRPGELQVAVLGLDEAEGVLERQREVRQSPEANGAREEPEGVSTSVRSVLERRGGVHAPSRGEVAPEGPDVLRRPGGREEPLRPLVQRQVAKAHVEPLLLAWRAPLANPAVQGERSCRRGPRRSRPRGSRARRRRAPGPDPR
jgi:hypothetical protein